jgi:hypothetical protein
MAAGALDCDLKTTAVANQGKIFHPPCPAFDYTHPAETEKIGYV